MSVQAITWALSIEDVTPTEKVVLLVLSNNADNDWSCWPKQSTIMRQACIKETALRLAIKRLKKRGLLWSTSRYVKGRRYSNFYRLKYEPLPSYYAGIDTGVIRGHIPSDNADTYKEEPSSEPSSRTVNCEDAQENDMASLEEIQKGFAEQPELTHEEIIRCCKSFKGKYTASPVVKCWRHFMRMYHPREDGNILQPSMEIIDQSKLKMAANKIGKKAPAIIGLCLADWTRFTNFVENAREIKITPDKPHVGFFLKYVKEAVTFMGDDKEDVVEAPVQSVAPTKMVEAPPDPPLMDLDLLKDM